MPNDKIGVWCIGYEGTEYFAAHSEEEVKEFYRSQCGNQEYCEDDLANHMRQITEDHMDDKFYYNDDSRVILTTWRELIGQILIVPNQIATAYM